MKLPILFLALTIPGLALAQEPAPALPADAAPANPAPAPADAPKPLPEPAELPPLPDPNPTSDPSDLMRNQPGSRLKPAPEPSLVPDRVPVRSKSSDAAKGRSTLKPPETSTDLDARIRYRQAHSRASHEPAIQALWHESRAARTDYQKRDALRRYFTVLYKRMLSFDKGIAPLVEERRRISLRRLDQTRIDPTDPLDEEHRQRRDY